MDLPHSREHANHYATDAVPFKYEAGVESGGGKLYDLDNKWGQVFRTDKLKNC